MAYTRKTSDIIISNELDCVLDQIKDNSEVARLLLKQRHSVESLVENHVNYISISNSDRTKISYLTTERSNFIIESSSLGEGADELWSSNRRFHVKPGAFVGKLFKNITPKEVENFSQLFRNAQTKINSKFEVVSGQSIVDYYHYDSYLYESGSLGNSCMKYDQCQDYFSLYTKNKDKISMLVLTTDNKKLIGRDLLWNLDDVKIMDRIYTIDDETYQYHFKKWADDNGYIYKREQKWNNTLFFESKGKTIYKEISLNLNRFNFTHFPYMDTFKFIDFNNGNIYNYLPKNVNLSTLSAADGTFYDGKIYDFCEKTKLLYSVDSLCYVPNIGMRVSSDICVYSSIFNLFILRDEANYDQNLRDWIYKDSELNNFNSPNTRKDETESLNEIHYPF
jgi:hypothetical protein